ncbi:hypothetical protein ElyMa_006373400 [Elysia marginata]|uniref:Ig-like domain-containing protein n=1 Tax=Elysia marginata TaxID=1093978 RepID=A0AAV4HPM0_9GAST|nr:hypothetical protein ElyMa_006373400 [Elysia marginata]
MAIFYHIPPNMLFVGKQYSITCHADQTEYGFIKWQLRWGNRAPMLPNQLGMTESNVVEGYKNKLGVCINRTKSTLSFKVERKHKNMVVTCYAYDAKGTKYCENAGKRFSFCDISRTLNVISAGPKNPPTTVISYEGSPGPINEGETLKASCTVLHDGTGMLQWVIYYPSGPQLVIPGHEAFASDKIVIVVVVVVLVVVAVVVVVLAVEVVVLVLVAIVVVVVVEVIIVVVVAVVVVVVVVIVIIVVLVVVLVVVVVEEEVVVVVAVVIVLEIIL